MFVALGLLADDVVATALARQDGSVVLAKLPCGAAVIRERVNGPKAVALVYVVARVPGVGEDFCRPL